MNVLTQISGNITPHNDAFRALEHMLSQLGIQVTLGDNDESLFYETNEHTAWQKYNSELAVYESIAECTFHIIYNDKPIDEEVALQIVYAMLKDRPILMTGAPLFNETLNPFIQRIILRHVSQFHAINLPELDLTELSVLLSKLKTTRYSLTNSEKLLIKNRVKKYFRTLLNEAKERHLAYIRSGIRPVKEN